MSDINRDFYSETKKLISDHQTESGNMSLWDRCVSVYNIIRFILQHNDNTTILGNTPFRTTLVSKVNKWFTNMDIFCGSETKASDSRMYINSMECMLSDYQFVCSAGIYAIESDTYI